MLKLIFVDKDSTEIEATCFGPAAEHFNDFLISGKVYRVSDARVNTSNERFRTVDFPYELMLEKYTRIE
jgi:ssDNA-binding replication factor A large subunit